jgi:hypothetical protein
LAKMKLRLPNICLVIKEIIINEVNNLYSRILSENKHLNAKIILDYCYIYGLGTELNDKKAFKLFKKSRKNWECNCTVSLY